MERKQQRMITDEDLDDLETASFGTIGDTVEERMRFWMAVEDAEANPKGDQITVKPAENPTWWKKAVAVVSTAPAFAQTVLGNAKKRNDQEPFELKVPTVQAFEFHQWAVSIDCEAPIVIAPGRGGRTQTRIIAELPHELDGRERLQIVKDFTDKLVEKGFPFWAVIHAPGANNDARNFHVHIAYYDRPSAKMKAPDGTQDVWDFEIQEKRLYSNRTKYLVRPYQQNRVRETNSQDWVSTLRSHWETVSNRALDKAGVAKRYNLGTYESMGIHAEPLKHVNSRTFNKERKGELTEDGPVLARRQWDNVHDRLVKQNEEHARARQARIERLADHASRLVRTQPNADHRTKDVQNFKELGIKASLQLALLELQQDLTRLVADRVASRAKLMLHAADKEELKTRKKRGVPLDAPPVDHPVAGADLLGMRTRSDLTEYLTTVYGGVLTLDRDNGLRTSKAKANVQMIVQELREWIRDPGKAPTVARRFSPNAVHSLDDPERLANSAAAKAEFTRAFEKNMEARAPEILSLIEKDIARSCAAAPAPPPSQPTQHAVPRMTIPPDTVAAETPIAKAEPTKPRYVAGRPGGESKPTEPARRARPAPFSAAELAASAREHRERNTPQLRRVAGTIAQQRPNTSVVLPSHPVPGVRQIPATAAPEAPAQPTGRMTAARPREAMVPSPGDMPITATPSVPNMSAEPDTQISVTSSVAATKRILIEPAASAATPTVQAEAKGPVCPVIMPEPHPIAKAPAPQKLHPLVPEIPAVLPAAPVSGAKQAIKETNSEPASKHQETKQSETLVSRHRDVEQLIPNLAAIMDEADKLKQAVETGKIAQSSMPTNNANPVDFQIIGARKPQSKRRARDRRRGPEL